MPYLTFQGKQIYYDVQGHGEPLVLLNGIMMSTLSWEPFVESLIPYVQLIRLDFLDQGKSSKLANETYTQALQVDVLKAVLDELQLKQVALMGISYGGEVALRFVTQHPDYVKRLLLFNTTAYTNPWLHDIGKAWNLAANTHVGEAYYYTTIPVIYSPEFYERRLDWMRRREGILFPVFGNPEFTDAMVRLTLSANDHDVRPLLHHITMPTLIVGCEQDYIVPLAQQEFLNREIKGSHLVKIPNSGHASMYERPVVFASLLLGFVLLPSTDFAI